MRQKYNFQAFERIMHAEILDTISLFRCVYDKYKTSGLAVGMVKYFGENPTHTS